MMNITQAINQIQEVADLYGWPFLEALEDISKHGRNVYSHEDMEAFQIVMRAGANMFAPAVH